MAAIEGLTQAQNDLLVTVHNGDLVIIHNPNYEAPLDDSGWDRLPRNYTGHIDAPSDYSHHPNAGAAIGDPGPDGYVSEDSNYVDPDRTRSSWGGRSGEGGQRVPALVTPPFCASEADEQRAEAVGRTTQDHERRVTSDIRHLQLGSPGDYIRQLEDAEQGQRALMPRQMEANLTRDSQFGRFLSMIRGNGNGRFDDQARAPSQSEQATRQTEAQGANGNDRDAVSDDEGDNISANGFPDDPADSDYADQVTATDNFDTDGPQSISSKSSHMFVVHTISRNAAGEIVDLKLRLLNYEKYPDAETARDEYSYQMYGTECVLHTPDTGLQTLEASNGAKRVIVGIKDIVDHASFEIFARPDADKARDVFGYETRCPFMCEDGWLEDAAEIEGTISNYRIPTTQQCDVLCPACAGIDLVKEYLNLKAEAYTQGLVDFSRLVEFWGRVNQRLHDGLNFEYEQFDEREWGYHFDDMLSEQGEDGDESDDNGQFQQWDEAMDPNADIVTDPASEITIAALPRKTYAEVKPADKEDEGPCAVCREDMADDTKVVVLPCKHFFCATGCVEQWLRQFSTCPTCRAMIREYELPEHENTYEISNALNYVGAVSRMLARIQPIAGSTDPSNSDVPKIYDEWVRDALQDLSQAILGAQRVRTQHPIDTIWANAVQPNATLRTLFPDSRGQAWFEPNLGSSRSGGVTLRDSENRSRKMEPYEINGLANHATRRLCDSIRTRFLDVATAQAQQELTVAEARMRRVMGGSIPDITPAGRDALLREFARDIGMMGTHTELADAESEDAGADELFGDEQDEEHEEDEQDKGEEYEEDDQSGGGEDAEEEGQAAAEGDIALTLSGTDNVTVAPMREGVLQLVALATAIPVARSRYLHADSPWATDQIGADTPFPNLADEKESAELMAFLRYSASAMNAVDDLSAAHAEHDRETRENRVWATRLSLHNAQVIVEERYDLLTGDHRSTDDIRDGTSNPALTARDQMRRLEHVLRGMFSPGGRSMRVGRAWRPDIGSSLHYIAHAELVGLAAELSARFGVAGLAREALSRLSDLEEAGDVNRHKDSPTLGDEISNEILNAQAYVMSISAYLTTDGPTPSRKGPGDGVPAIEAALSVDALAAAQIGLAQAEHMTVRPSVKEILLDAAVHKPEAFQQRFRRAVLGSWFVWNSTHPLSTVGSVARSRKLTAGEIDEVASQAVRKLYALVKEDEAPQSVEWVHAVLASGDVRMPPRLRHLPVRAPQLGEANNGEPEAAEEDTEEDDGGWHANFGTGQVVRMPPHPRETDSGERGTAEEDTDEDDGKWSARFGAGRAVGW